MSSLRDIIKKAINLSNYTKELKDSMLEQDIYKIGDFLDTYGNKENVAESIKYLQNEYGMTDNRLGLLFGYYEGERKRDFYWDEKQIIDDFIDEAIENFVKKQEQVIDNVPSLKRTISSPLTEQEFIEYLSKPDTKLGRYWSISKPHAVEGKEGHKYEYTFVIDKPSLQEIDVKYTVNVRLICEDIEDEITLKPNASVKLIGLLNENGQEIELPSNVKNKTFRI